ncbi:hypothetical protein QTG56_01895 [Rossellomorea sp. AcN35-11]|nr:hypothetical protein [Rossellomorea aquimaris]WJV29941.1 hypothetical protein QTG56_01895 [Rossellomorea sp. AcN35-11]
MTSKKNKVASALTVVGILSITSGVVSGLYYGMSDGFMQFGPLQTGIGFGLFLKGVLWGIVFFGFAEIIKLLQGIFNQREPAPPEEPQPDPPAPQKETEKGEISPFDRREIEAFYADKGWTVEDVEKTDREDFYLVTVNGKKELVELGGFKPKIHPH